LKKKNQKIYSRIAFSCFLLPQKINLTATKRGKTSKQIFADGDVNIVAIFYRNMSRHSSPLGRMISVIECPNSSLRFLILDCPTESTLDFYMEEFMRRHVVAVVRCCQPTYSTARLNEENIQVLDLPFKDGGVVRQ
jgi:hypothetical protein